MRRATGSCRCCSARARLRGRWNSCSWWPASPNWPGVTGARLVGGRRWDVYLDGRIEVRLPANGPSGLAAPGQGAASLGRDHPGGPSIDLRNPDWLTLELPDAAIGQGTEPRA